MAQFMTLQTLNSHLDSLTGNVPIHIENVVHLRPVALLDFAVMNNCVYDVTTCISPKFKAKWLLGTDRGAISLFILPKVSMLKEFDQDYRQNTLLPKLEAFFDNCLGPE